MTFSNDIIGEILNFTGLDPSLAFISKQWKEEVQKNILKEYTILSIIFPNTFQIPNCLFSENLCQIKKKTYVRKIESWIDDNGGISITSKQIKKLKLPSKIFKDNLTKKDLDFYNDKKDIICFFTQEWKNYFISLRIRTHSIPLILFFPNILDQRPKYRYAWGLSSIEKFLFEFKWRDRLDESKMDQLEWDKDWLCWEDCYEADDLDEYLREEFIGYGFQEDTWKELETLYSFVSGYKEREPPFTQNFYEINDDRDESRRVIENIEKYKVIYRL